MPDPQTPIDYSIIKPRRPSLLAMKATLLLPGVRKVVRQITPYAEAWRKSNDLELQKKGPLWVVLGDSTAQGLGAPSIEQGWVGQLAKVLKESGKNYRLVNLSFNRARTQDVLTKQIPAMERLGVKPELVTIFIGFNDFTRKKFRASLPQNLKKIIEKLPAGAVIGNIPALSGLAKSLNELIVEEANRHGLKVADILVELLPLDKKKFASDHYHPNEIAYADYARAFAHALGIKPNAF